MKQFITIHLSTAGRCVASLLVLALLTAMGPHKPTNAELLAAAGFAPTVDGMTAAMQSDDAFAAIYALRLAQEREDATFLAEANRLLRHEFIKVRLEAAKLLGQFDVPMGLQWLRDWETNIGDDPAVHADVAHVVLDAAMFLAERDDARLAAKVQAMLQHEQWSVKIHAARALGSFADATQPPVQQAWLKAAEVATNAINAESPAPEQFVGLYLHWLDASARKQDVSTLPVRRAFITLSDQEHAATATARESIALQWLALPMATAQNGGNGSSLR